MVPPPADLPEQRAREQIDAMLAAAGWAVQHRSQMNLAAAPGVAIRELRTEAGPADYALFLGNQLVGVVEAKKAGVTLSTVEAQTRAYAERAPQPLQVPIRPLPFLYESTGVETFFTNGLDPEPRARQLFWFHRPETLQAWLDAELDRRHQRPGAPPAPTLKGRLQHFPPLNTAGMWPAQIRAVENLEASLRDGKPRALIQMATGGGKTFTAISAVYRLVKEGGARRVLFLVDRGNLGRQALKEFQAYTTPDDGRKFTELYNAVNLTHNTIDPVNKVVITTIQRLYSILKGEPQLDEDLEEGSAFAGHGAALLREPPPVVYSPTLPPEFFDVVIVDECHRSIYTLWRQVLEYFDAALIGLTATPANHTYAFFHKNVVSEYTHVQAVRDRVNVPFQVYDIRTRVTEGGGLIVAEAPAGAARVVVGRRDRQTRAVRWETLDEDLPYAAEQVDRSVVVPDQIRTVVRTLKQKMFTDIFPGRRELPKTLIFAKSDDHAEDILRILREEWPLSNEAAVKVTYKPESGAPRGAGRRAGASYKPEALIASFRNSYNPRVAVTVDMIATGTDIKPLE
ncbi:MAG: DEAD/DEAH box helicase family protein, partial [Deltaproteobacteria bacterium]|nr:DEAD/DEAH box helicase family protein [Deltaproteobacteria bacterium]